MCILCTNVNVHAGSSSIVGIYVILNLFENIEAYNIMHTINLISYIHIKFCMCYYNTKRYNIHY